jgi:predicted O-methyltransferase YrrM
MYAGDFEILLEFSKDKEIIVELGTARGLGAMVLSSNGGTVYTIDNCDRIDRSAHLTTALETEEERDDWHRILGDYLANWRNIKLIRSDTSESANIFEDSSVDLLFIDGDHRYFGIERDYDAWIDKVKEDGIILFHDCDEAIHPDVYRFCRNKEIDGDVLEPVNYETEYNTVTKIFRKVRD